MDARDAREARQAMALLGQGRAGDAHRIARDLRERAPASVDAWHLEALCLAELMDLEAADAAFSEARRRASGHPLVLANQARWFARTRRPRLALDAWEAVLAIDPRSAEAAMGRAGALLALGRPGDALAAFDHAGRLGASPSKVALGHAAAHRLLGDLEKAADAVEAAGRIASDAVEVNVEKALVSRLQGRPGRALDLLLSRRPLDAMAAPELEATVGALVDLLRIDEAHEVAVMMVTRFPQDAAGHRAMAQLRWEYPRTEAEAADPFGALRDAITRSGDPVSLQLALAGLLLDARQGEEAHALIAPLRARGDGPQLQAMAANALEMSGESEAAAALYRQADRYLGDHDVDFGNAYVRHLLRAGRFEQAAARAEANLALDPDRQETWAYLATAWRLLGDPREAWLCRYEELVAVEHIPVPPGWSRLDDFLVDLERCLLPYHRAKRAPVAQSLRSGTQTPGRLFGRDDAPIRALQAALRETIAAVVDRWPADVRHPFLRRASRHVHFAGSWSVRLWQSGSHANHFHNEGWMSSAFYVSLPPSTRSGEGHAGWLQFGQPPEELRLDLAPRRIIQPRPGALALFPSFLWHGTVPFEDEASRLTVAFDVLPACG